MMQRFDWGPAILPSPTPTPTPHLVYKKYRSRERDGLPVKIAAGRDGLATVPITAKVAASVRGPGPIFKNCYQPQTAGD